jgi:hypothetical protein
MGDRRWLVYRILSRRDEAVLRSLYYTVLYSSRHLKTDIWILAEDEDASLNGKDGEALSAILQRPVCIYARCRRGRVICSIREFPGSCRR